MQQSRTPGKGLQVRTKDEDQEKSRRLRWRRQWQKERFCWRFGVGTIKQTFVHNNSQNWYVIPNWQNNKARELNVYTNVKTKNRKELWLQALVDSRCTHTGINKQLVKEERIKTEPMKRLFKVFNADGMKNGEVTQFVPLEIEINRHKEQIDVAVTDLNSMDMFLGYNWLVKHNLEVNWNTGTMWFTRYLKTCRTRHQDILFTSN